MHYKAVGFDYGGVIGGIHPSGPGFSDQVCALLDIDKPTYNEAFFSIYRTINLGEVATWREFLQNLLDKFGQPEKLDKVIAINDKEEQSLRVINQAMLDLVDAIHQRGIKRDSSVTTRLRMEGLCVRMAWTVISMSFISRLKQSS
jgi:hypothetical protein